MIKETNMALSQRSRGPATRRIAAAALALIVTGLLAAGCSGSSSGTATADPKAPVKVKIVTLAGSFVSMPIAVADVEGLFTKNGINPTFIKTSAGTTASAALVSGSADMGLLASAEGLVAISKGQPLQWVAGLTTSYMAELVGSTAANLPNRAAGYPAAITDLKGKKIGVTSIGSSSYYALLSLLSGAGLSKSDVTIIGSGGNPAEVAGLQNHQLDAAILTDPLTYQVNKQGIATTLTSFYKGSRPAIFESNMLNGFAATTDYIQKNPTIIKAATDAIAEADQLLDSFQTAADALPLATKLQAQFTGTTPQELADLIIQDRGVWTPTITQDAMAHAQQLTQQAGTLPKLLDYNTIVDQAARG